MSRTREVMDRLMAMADAVQDEDHWIARVLTSLALSIATGTTETMGRFLEPYTDAQEAVILRPSATPPAGGEALREMLER